MATLEHRPSSGNMAHTANANSYICDGHGDEVLVRTNRYMDDGHGLTTEVRGYGCPPDPELATQLMMDLRTQYENNLAGRKTKGTTDTKSPVSHEHFFISWHTDEHPSPAERHDMIAELIQRTKLKDFPCLVADHNNTDEDHIHISAGVFSLDGTRKLGMNNRLLYEMRREMDYICYEHGYSIVENPKLFGSEEYKKWFYERKAAGDLVIHPPKDRQDRWKKTQKEQYADAKGYTRRSDLIKKQPPMTAENRGTHFYCLPHLFDPTAEHGTVKQPLYIYAMDQDGERLAPIQLAFDLEQQWCSRILDHLRGMEYFPSMGKMMQRIDSTLTAAKQNRDLLQSLDIGTISELRMHMKHVGKDLNRCREYIEEQKQALEEAIQNNDTIAEEKARARKAKSEEREAALSLEYRKLKKASQMYQELMDPEKWSDYTEKFLGRSASMLTTEQQFDDTVRHHFHDIGQLLGHSHREIDEILNAAKTIPKDIVLSKWVEHRGNLSITYTRTSAGVSAIYQHIGDLNEQRAALRETSNALTSTLGLLFFPITLPLLIKNKIEEAKLEEQIAATRQLAEEIRYHNKNVKNQLNFAKSKAAHILAAGGVAYAALAWEEFSSACDEIIMNQMMLQSLANDIPRPYWNEEMTAEEWLDADPSAAVRDYTYQINKYKAEFYRMIEQMKWEDLHRTDDPDQTEDIPDSGPEVDPELTPVDEQEPSEELPPQRHSLDDLIKGAKNRAAAGPEKAPNTWDRDGYDR